MPLSALTNPDLLMCEIEWLMEDEDTLDVFRANEDWPKPLSHCESSSAKSALMKSRVFGVFFYSAIAALVLIIYLFSGNSAGVPRNFMGFSTMTVLTRSMQSEIPQHSLIVTRQADANTIKIGDDITYLLSANATVTHRVISIKENYANSGQRGFETQGVMNPVPDKEIVLAHNVIGKVVFHNLFLGNMIQFVKNHMIYVIIFTVLLMGFVAAMKICFKPKQKLIEGNI